MEVDRGMASVEVPVRYYRDLAPHYDYAHETLSVPLEQTPFLLVDVNGLGEGSWGKGKVSRDFIAPALAAAREAGMLVAFVHNDLRLVTDEGNIVYEVWGKTKGIGTDAWKRSPKRIGLVYEDYLRPLPSERDFPKWAWSGFRDTFLDQHLRAHGIKTLVCVGYSSRACLYGTLIDAVYRNYRVVVLRDSVLCPEMPDTENSTFPEGGWLNRIMVRQIEHLIGYTSTSQEFVAACMVLCQN
jgi:ureidoacrylate peracid hydrolase